MDGRVHRIFVSVAFGKPVSFQPSVDNEVAHRSEFLLERGRAEPESHQFRRVWSVDRTICPLRSAFCVAALQQIIFNAILERTICAQCRSPQAPFTYNFDQYVLQWMGEDAFDVPCFHPPENNVRFDVPMTSELTAVCQGPVKVGTSPDFSDCAGIPSHNPS